MTTQMTDNTVSFKLGRTGGTTLSKVLTYCVKSLQKAVISQQDVGF